jgi:hypothetical protein
MKLSFDSIEEVKEFVASLKGTRGKKGDTEDPPSVPAPAQPPTTGFVAGPQQAVFAPGPQAPVTPAFPVATVDPAVASLVQRISTKLDAAIAGGQNADAALAWFRNRCGAEAANATMDQIKTVYLTKLSVPNLEETAKLMGA